MVSTRNRVHAHHGVLQEARDRFQIEGDTVGNDARSAEPMFLLFPEHVGLMIDLFCGANLHQEDPDHKGRASHRLVSWVSWDGSRYGVSKAETSDPSRDPTTHAHRRTADRGLARDRL